MTKTENKKTKEEDATKVAGINVKDVDPGTTIVVLPNNSQIPVKFDFDTSSDDVVRHLRSVSSNSALMMSKVDKDEKSDELQVRVITLKSNARSKGN